MAAKTITSRLKSLGYSEQRCALLREELQSVRAELKALLTAPQIGKVYTRSGPTADLPAGIATLVLLRRARANYKAGRHNHEWSGIAVYPRRPDTLANLRRAAKANGLPAELGTRLGALADRIAALPVVVQRVV